MSEVAPEVAKRAKAYFEGPELILEVTDGKWTWRTFVGDPDSEDDLSRAVRVMVRKTGIQKADVEIVALCAIEGVRE